MEGKIVTHLEKIVEEARARKKKTVDIERRKFSIETLEHIWVPYLKLQSEPQPLKAPIMLNGNFTYLRNIRTGALVETNVNGFKWSLLGKEEKERTRWKTFGGNLDLTTEAMFQNTYELERETGEEGLWGIHRVNLRTLKPIGVRVSPDGRILQFYDVKLLNNPTPTEIRNPVPEKEKVIGRYFNMHQLTEMMNFAAEDIHQETVDILLTQYMWKRAIHVTSLKLPIELRKEILDGMKIGMDPEKVMQTCEIYVATPKRINPFIPLAKIFVSTGIFLYETTLDAEQIGLKKSASGNFESLTYHAANEFASTECFQTLREKIPELYKHPRAKLL